MRQSRPILDVRDRQAFALAHASQAANIPFSELPHRMHELPPKGSEILVFHDDPSLAVRAMAMLAERGYSPLAPRLSPDDLSETGASSVHLWSPSPFLCEAWEMMREALPQRPRALDLGCGSGRESVWLALHGCDVDAIDILPDALAKAQGLAGNAGVTIRTICRDLLKGAPAADPSYDLVCTFRFNCRPLFAAIPAMLRPGGWAIIEGFHARDAESGKAGRNAGKLLADGELPLLLPGMELRSYADAVLRDDRWFSQLVVRRPAERSKGALERRD
jgi:tellurite methyltransferase